MGRNIFRRKALGLLVFCFPLQAQQEIPETAWPWGQTEIASPSQELTQNIEEPALEEIIDPLKLNGTELIIGYKPLNPVESVEESTTESSLTSEIMVLNTEEGQTGISGTDQKLEISSNLQEPTEPQSDMDPNLGQSIAKAETESLGLSPQKAESPQEDMSPQTGLSLGPYALPQDRWQATLDIPDHPLITQYEKSFLPGGNGHQHLKRSLELGKPFLAFIHQKAVEYGVPTELMWLPVIESSFIGTAGSWAGARGLWQFMLNSISQDMRVDSWRDDRLDFWLATEAAFYKLKFNYNHLGDWALSLAAYNAGLGRIRGLISRYGGNYWDLLVNNRLPRETSKYVPKFYALVRVMRSAYSNGLDFGWDSPEGMEEWTRIPLGNKQVDLNLLADHASIPITNLRAWNLELRNRVTPPNGYFLKVPRRYEEKVRSVLSNPALASMRYYRYEVKQGDTVSELADYYGISQGLINRYNPSVRGANIRIGQTLLIPSVKDVPPYPSRPAPARVAVRDSGRRHEVVDGDTLWSLSRRFETTVEAIKELNNLSTNGILKIGMSLKIPL